MCITRNGWTTFWDLCYIIYSVCVCVCDRAIRLWYNIVTRTTIYYIRTVHFTQQERQQYTYSVYNYAYIAELPHISRLLPVTYILYTILRGVVRLRVPFSLRVLHMMTSSLIIIDVYACKYCTVYSGYLIYVCHSECVSTLYTIDLCCSGEKKKKC